jgi:hypothetical protein
MRKTLCVAVLFVLLAPAAAAVATGAPMLRLADRTPLTVAGTSFSPRELVRVTASVEDDTVSRSVRAGPLGGFTMRFLALSAGRCDDLRVVARGASGTRAVLKVLPPDACRPLPGPAENTP